MKDKIIDEAIFLFSENGYYNTSLNEISSKVNIKKASLYYHYKNKDDIYIECINFIEGHFTKHVFDCYSKKQFSYEDYYNLLHFILFEIDIKYVKFMAQLMYAPENLSQTVMKLLLKFKKSFDLIVNEYYKCSHFEQGYTLFYYFILNNSVTWCYKGSWASNYGKLNIIEKEYRENMHDLCENFISYE